MADMASQSCLSLRGETLLGELRWNVIKEGLSILL